MSAGLAPRRASLPISPTLRWIYPRPASVRPTVLFPHPWGPSRKTCEPRDSIKVRRPLMLRKAGRRTRNLWVKKRFELPANGKRRSLSDLVRSG